MSNAISTVDSVGTEVGAALGQKVPYEVYEHHAPFLFPKWALGSDEAPRILRQKRRRASIAEGEGGCSDFSPAHRFTLHDHGAAQLDGAYVVTTVEHRGESYPSSESAWRVYWNTFECAPAQMPYPPPRPKRKSVQVSLTATVTVPLGEEIYVDEKGQIKVQFHWDREGQYDENSSCWIRVMQPWAGAAWGHQFIPRVGMEVVVTFEGGDPDKPMVLGSFYNGTHPPAFPLPQEKTKSGIRTQSTPGAHGHHEISFDDRAGQEMLHVHAQKDYEEIVLHNQTSRVDGGRAVDVRGSASERIGKDATLDVVGSRTTLVGGADRRRVEGRLDDEVKGDYAVDVHGSSSMTVEKGHSLAVGGRRALVVGTPTEGGSSDHYVYGAASMGASERIVINADQGIVLRCGESTIEVLPDKIVLRAATVELSPTQALECSSGGGPSMTLGKDVEILTKKFRLFTESGALEVDQDFKAKGSAIKLGYDASKPSKDQKNQDGEKKPFSCKLSNYFLQPFAQKKYHLMVGGLRLEGETDSEGTVTQQIPKSATQVVVRLWIDDYPEGQQRVYTLSLADLPAAEDAVGAKHRLKNLGYYSGLMDAALNDELRAALAEFQQDHRETHGLSPTGELDGGTAGALEEVHGS